MSFKNGGYKTTWIEEYGYYMQEYTIYAAEECCTETMVYRMFDSNGKEHDINISAENDIDAIGNRSLIDCLYYLKQRRNKKYPSSFNDIIIEEMTSDEMMRVFDHP